MLSAIWFPFPVFPPARGEAANVNTLSLRFPLHKELPRKGLMFPQEPAQFIQKQDIVHMASTPIPPALIPTQGEGMKVSAAEQKPKTILS